MQEFPENGGCFIPHCEQGGVPVARRIISWMIYLNNARSGTYFLFQDQTIEASQGKVVIWPAAWTHIHHGVIPNQDKKYIVSGWCSFIVLLYPRFLLSHLRIIIYTHATLS